MRIKFLHCGKTLAVAVLMLVGTSGTSRCADQPSASAPSPSAANQQLSDLLRDVINQGADLYNGGDRNGCYRLFQGALLVLRGQLTDPDMRKRIDTGLAEAERQASPPERAYALRRVLDDIRERVKPQRKQAVDSGAPRTERGVAPPKRPANALWDRLGGDSGVKKAIDDFVDLAGADPKVNFARNGKYKLDAAAVTRLKAQLFDFVSQATGGPYSYRGKSMKEAHRGMGITNAEFDAAAADLKKALEKNGVKPADVEEVMQLVATTRADIVEAMSAPEKKPAKKPHDTKKSGS
jgi:hemoglobin